MRIIHRQAVQAHAVPSHVLEARGPFQRQEPKVEELSYDPDFFPPGATAQNGMREVVMYECRNCQAAVRDDDLESHICRGDV